jgi:hypothetical protein
MQFECYLKVILMTRSVVAERWHFSVILPKHIGVQCEATQVLIELWENVSWSSLIGKKSVRDRYQLIL